MGKLTVAKARERAFANRVAVARQPACREAAGQGADLRGGGGLTLEATRARWRTGGKTEKRFGDRCCRNARCPRSGIGPWTPSRRKMSYGF